MYNVQNIVTGKTKEVHFVRMHAYADSSLAVGAEVQGLFETTKHEDEYEMQDILTLVRIYLKRGTTKCKLRWSVSTMTTLRGIYRAEVEGDTAA